MIKIHKASSDRELLAAYAAEGREDAFRELVDRYAGLVHAACLRQLSNHQQAEDASQAVFLILAEKAGALVRKENLAGWIYRTACYVAFTMKRGEERRLKRERKVADMHETSGKGETRWQDLKPRLDHALGALSQRLRDALLLHYFQGKSQKEVAIELGCTEKAVQKRVSRGVEKLRKRLAKEGFVLSIGILAGFLSTNVTEAVPPGLAARCHAAAMTGAGKESASPAGLKNIKLVVKGTRRRMMWNKIKLGVFLITAAVAAGLGSAAAVLCSGTAEPGINFRGTPLAAGESAVSVRSYWRYYWTFGPVHEITAEGRLKLAGSLRFATQNGTGWISQMSTAPPPDDWMKPEFDDSFWPVQRLPLGIPTLYTGIGFSEPQIIRRTCARTRFIVPDPDKAGKLRLTIRCYGGVIAYINGKEAGRTHIASAGPLADEFYAEPYTEEAYRPASHEQMVWARNLPQAGNTRILSRRWWSGQLYWLSSPRSVEKRWGRRGVELVERIDRLRRRTLDIEIPGRLLRRGVNVLALEGRRSPVADHYATTHIRYRYIWAHAGIQHVELSAASAGTLEAAEARSSDTQVWVEDIHRRMTPDDFLEPGVRERRVLRLACPRGAASSAQVAIGTATEIRSPSASVGNLSGPGGTDISSSNLTLRWARPFDLARLAGQNLGRCGGVSPNFLVARNRPQLWKKPLSYFAFERGRLPTGKYWNAIRGGKDPGMPPVEFFDCLSSEPPKTIPANTCQSLWLTAEVPGNIRAGLYRGKLTVTAGPSKSIELEVRLQVFDWTIPDIRDARGYAGVDESPWALAEWAKVKLWSEEHWKLLEESVAWAGKLGARAACIPAIQDTELGNRKDTLVTWIKRPDGGYDYDFSRADRYLKLWKKYCHKKSDAIVYITLQSRGRYQMCGGPPGAVTLRDPSTGKESPFNPMNPGKEINKSYLKENRKGFGKASADRVPDDPGIKRWVAFCKTVRTHLNRQGFPDERIHWGLFHDKIEPSSRDLAVALAKELPGIGWARASHEGCLGRRQPLGKNGGFVSLDAAIRGTQKPPFRIESSRKKIGRRTVRVYKVETYRADGLKGWSNPRAPVALSRDDTDSMAFGIFPPLWQLRAAMELPITSAYRGFARFCLDGWKRGGYWGPYVPFMVYPEEGGILGSAQLEVLREGIQEAEARIFLESREKMSEKARRVLARRAERIWVAPCLTPGARIMEYHYGWQELSWDLYAAAAKAAGGTAPTAEEKKKFFEPFSN